MKVLNFRDFLNGGENQPGWDLNRYLLIPRRLILESRVEVGSPSLAAAPWGPDTRPRLWASAPSMASFSWASNTPLKAAPERGTSEASRLSHASSTAKMFES